MRDWLKFFVLGFKDALSIYIDPYTFGSIVAFIFTVFFGASLVLIILSIYI
jgi:hypothetical protein